MAECNEDSYLAILHLSRVELHCKLQETFHRVTWPLVKPTYNNRLCICFECINSHVAPKIHGKTLYCFKLVIYLHNLLHTPARYTVLAFCAPIKPGFYRPGNEIRRGKQ